jgi:hypothetical protein
MGLSNIIMNLLKIRSGKIITKKVDVFLFENFIKVIVSHLAVLTYYPFAKKLSKSLFDRLTTGSIWD